MSNSAKLGSTPAPSGGGLDWGAGAAKTAETESGPGFWDKARSVVGKVEAVAAGATGTLKEGLGDALHTAADGIGSGLDLAGDLVSSAGAWVGDGVAGAGDMLGNGVETVQAGWGSLVGAGTDLAGDALELGLDMVGDGIRSGAETGAAALDLVGMDRLGDILELTGAGADQALDTAGMLVDEHVNQKGQEAESFIRGTGAAANQLLTGGSQLLGSGIALVGQEVDATLDMSALGYDLLGDALEGLMDRWAVDDFLAAEAWLQLSHHNLQGHAADKDADRLYGGVELLQSEGNELSEYGLPLTEDAWKTQREIDGGKLQTHYKRSVVSTLVDTGLVDPCELGITTLPASFAEVDPETLDDWFALIEAKVGSGAQLLDALPGDVRKDLQETVIHSYVDEANQTEGSTFVLELLPTDTDSTVGSLWDEGLDWLVGDELPDGFVPSPTVMQARDTAVGVSDVQGTETTFALPVPYANTVPNVMLRNLVPSDGADNLQALLGLLGDDVTTVGTGYSQGAAALNESVRRQGEDPSLKTLDFAISLASMGGADMQGGDGWYAGGNNGTQMFSAMHEDDPAIGIHPHQSVFDRIQELWNFGAPAWLDPRKDGDAALHGETCWDHPDAQGCALDPDTGQPTDQSTLGYPEPDLKKHIEDLINGKHEGEEFERKGDWDKDIREQLARLRRQILLARQQDPTSGAPLG